jgi:hypothetical protein
MPYYRFTEDELEYANHVDIIKYARRQGYEVVEYHKGYYKIPGYGGLLLEPDKWYWEAEQRGGGPIQFVMMMKKLNWVEAMKELLNESKPDYMYHPVEASMLDKTNDKSKFRLPRQNTTYKHIFAYLVSSRQLDSALVQSLVKDKKLYEDDRENCIFVGYDKNQTARYAFRRSTKPHVSFKGDVRGSDKRYSFSISGTTDQLYVFEAAIDLLSFMTLKKHRGESLTDHYVSLAGCSLLALDSYLIQHPDVQIIRCCTDHDEAGEKAYEEIMEQYGMLYFISRNSPAPCKDWNQYLVKYKFQEFLREQES